MGHVVRTTMLVLVAVLVAGPGGNLGARLTARGGGATTCDATTLSGGYGALGHGNLGTRPFTLIGAFVFDGRGRFTASGKLVLDDVKLVEPFTMEGTYAVDSACTGSFEFVLHHENFSRTDHVTRMYAVVTGRGQRFSAVNTEVEFPEGTSLPVESVTVSGDRM